MGEYDPLQMQFDGDRDADKIAGRLRFEKWRLERNPENTTTTPVPDELRPVKTQESQGTGMGRLLDMRKRKSNFPKPGI